MVPSISTFILKTLSKMFFCVLPHSLSEDFIFPNRGHYTATLKAKLKVPEMIILMCQRPCYSICIYWYKKALEAWIQHDSIRSKHFLACCASIQKRHRKNRRVSAWRKSPRPPERGFTTWSSLKVCSLPACVALWQTSMLSWVYLTDFVILNRELDCVVVRASKSHPKGYGFDSRMSEICCKTTCW